MKKDSRRGKLQIDTYLLIILLVFYSSVISYNYKELTHFYYVLYILNIFFNS